MKVSYQWLREWVSVRLDPHALARRLTLAGLEVGAIAPVASSLARVVVGKVLSVAAHPRAPGLKVCKIDVGKQRIVQLVCGAPIVDVGAKVALALPGAELANGRRLEIADIQGAESGGMLCSAAELGLGDETDRLLVLDASARVGAPVADILALNDVTLDLELTPNRGDCLSMVGVAREVAAVTGSRLATPAKPKIPVRTRERVAVKITAKKDCPRYVGRVVRDLNRAAVTPMWMRERLRRAGVRSLIPVVDITNYVMLELGQPMHAFDMRKLRGAIRVRAAAGTESFKLLDGRDLRAPAGSLLIADDRDGIALAGVMGGDETAVGAETTAIFFESAFFAPDSVARYSRALGIQTESSQRFERGVDPQLQLRALERATELLLQIAGGKAGPITQAGSPARAERPIRLRAARVERVIGYAISRTNVERVLKALSIANTRIKDGWLVTPPSYRFDIRIEEDLIEEIARVTGYENVPARLPTAPIAAPAVSESRRTPTRLRALLVDRDYQEVITYSFVDPVVERLVNPAGSPPMLANPIGTDMAAMRTTLWPGLLRTLQYNLNRQRQRIRVFEIGRRFADGAKNNTEEPVVAAAVTGPVEEEQWGLTKRPADFYDIKGDVEALLGGAGQTGDVSFRHSEHPALHPGQTAAIYVNGEQIGLLGVLHPGLQARLELGEVILFEIRLAALTASAIPTYRDVSRYPAIRRDLAIVVAEDVAAASVLNAVQKAAGKLLVNVQLFDVYRGEGIDSGRKSLALGLTLQDSSRTLKEAEVDSLMAQIVSTLGDELGGELRR
ncbi:MAG TPA: phenylalanine--tRNA ligase subunit beta [Burkholderiales bacterium]